MAEGSGERRGEWVFSFGSWPIKKLHLYQAYGAAVSSEWLNSESLAQLQVESDSKWLLSS